MFLALLAHWNNVVHCHPLIVAGLGDERFARKCRFGESDDIFGLFTFSFESVEYGSHVGCREDALDRFHACGNSCVIVGSTEVHLCERTVKLNGFRQCTIDFQLFAGGIEGIAFLVVGFSSFVRNLDVLQVGDVVRRTFGCLCPEHEVVRLAFHEAECHLCFQVCECGSLVEFELCFRIVVLIN